MKKIIKICKSNKGVSEVLGTVLLLGIAVAIFSALYLIVLSEPFEASEPYPRIVAYLEGQNLIVEHRGGDELGIDTRFSLTIGGENIPIALSEDLDDINSDGKWNFGERVIKDIGNSFSLTNSTAGIFGVDDASNRAIFSGDLNIFPENDIGVEIKIDNEEPIVGEYINITIIVHNYRGDISATGVKINFIIPEGLKYDSHVFITSDGSEYNNSTTSKYNYDNGTGLWEIDNIAIRDSVSLKIKVLVIGAGVVREPTQLAMVLDGSGSISSDDWIIMRTGLANAIENSDVFPHDGSVEFTVVQFGYVGPPKAQVEIGPIIVNETNTNSIKDAILDIDQMVVPDQGGATPMSCGIRLAADQLFNIGDFEINKRQIINLVTDGVPNCDWTPGTYNGTWLGNCWYRDDSRKKSGSYSMASSSSQWGEMISKDLDAEGASSITIDFWYRLHDTESDDLKLCFYDGNSYDFIASLGGGTENTWLHYTKTINDPQYLISNFQIRFDTYCYNYYYGESEQIWIDDVLISTDSVLLNDSFEGTPWNVNWWNFGKASAEEAKDYLVGLLGMDEDDDEFDAMAVGTGPDTYWLRDNIVWPQPGYEGPPFDSGPGWVTHITSWTEFESAISEMFRVQFSAIKTTVQITSLDSKDPYSGNDIYTVKIVPTDK